MRVGDHDLVPYVLGTRRFAKNIARQSPLEGTRFFDVLDDESVTFFRLVNAGNAVAFGDIGMPAWVQLDCATIPSAMIGFALRRPDVCFSLSLVRRHGTKPCAARFRPKGQSECSAGFAGT